MRNQWLQCITYPSLLILAGSVHAATPPTLTVGNQTKNVLGTIVNVNQGDISCYLTLKDDAGKQFQESASFDLCVNSLVGKRVQLGYSMENVQARSCQGDPSCKKTDRIALVTSAKVLAEGAGAPIKAASFCNASEAVVFTCATGVKMVSVCASRNLSLKAGYVQYRFGTPGQAPEITLPAGEVHPLKAAYGSNEMYAGGGASWLRFRRGTYGYVVYSGIGRWGANGATMEKQGLAVENNGKVVANLKCKGRPDGELGPQWFEKAGIAPNGKEDFSIPD